MVLSQAVRARAFALAMVLVGALNVGSIHVLWDPALKTNGLKRAGREIGAAVPRRFSAGEEAARFELGSTVVLILPEDALAWEDLQPGQRVRMGERLGTWT